MGEISFEEWIAPHWPAMRRLAERLAGATHRDDVLQEALVAAWRQRATFDPGRGTEQAWLLGITANQAKKALRGRSRAVPLREVAVEQPAGTRVDLDRAIAALPARQRLAVELCYFVGVPVAEAAAVMQCAEGTVKSTLSAARRQLRATLGDDYR